MVEIADGLDETFDSEADEDAVNLLVQNIMPPFLDGRMVFTKQAAPVVPVSFEHSFWRLFSFRRSAT